MEEGREERGREGEERMKGGREGGREGGRGRKDGGREGGKRGRKNGGGRREKGK